MFHGIKWATVGVRKVFTPCPPPLGTLSFPVGSVDEQCLGHEIAQCCRGVQPCTVHGKDLLCKNQNSGFRGKMEQNIWMIHLFHTDYLSLNLQYMGWVSSFLCLFTQVPWTWTFEPYVSERPQHSQVIHIFSINKGARLDFPQISVFTRCISKFVLSISLTLGLTERHPRVPGATSKHLPWQLPLQDCSALQPGCSVPRRWGAGLEPGDRHLAGQQSV